MASPHLRRIQTSLTPHEATMRGMTALLAGIVLLSGCGNSTGTGTDAASAAYRGTPSASRADVQENKDAAALRAATEKFHKIEGPAQARWNDQAPPGRFTSPPGAMGYHLR